MGEKKHKVKFVVTDGFSALDTVIVDLSYVKRHASDKVFYAKRGLAEIYKVEANQIYEDKTYSYRNDKNNKGGEK